MLKVEVKKPWRNHKCHSCFKKLCHDDKFYYVTLDYSRTLVGGWRLCKACFIKLFKDAEKYIEDEE